MQDRSPGEAPSILEDNPADEDILAVRDIFGSFLIALRNFTLYPEDHAICRKSLAAVRDRLEGFLAGRGSLLLTVEKERFLFQGEAVRQGTPQQEELAFQLFREGIQWLEFHSGITQEELNAFFGLLNRYRTVTEDAEGDLVTALWEADFPHLKYHNEDVLWEAEPLMDFSLLKTSPGEARAAQEDEEDQAAPAVRISLPEASSAYWKLTPEEEREIAAMILDEGTRDCTEDVLDVLMIILKEQRDPNNFSVILDFLVEEFRYTLAGGEFSFARKFLESLNALQESCAPDRPWTRPLLDDFRKKISGPEVLGALEGAWPQVEAMGADRREDLRQALLLLPAEAILALGPMLTSADLPRGEELLRGVIGVHAGRNLEPLEQLLETAAEPLIRKLIPLLKELDGPGPAELLFRLTSDFPDQVRKDAINALIAPRELKAKIILPPFEHHLKYDLSGYPQTDRKKPLSLFGRILTITDIFDAMTSPRIYRPVALSPDRVLTMMLEGAGKDFDPILLKVFINMLGVFPVGTLLLLDTGEMCLVMESPEGAEVGRPRVVILEDGKGGGFRKGETANLAERDPRSGAFRRNIVKSFHPSEYGIQPVDFLV
ncbi:MAG: hypothetical protein KJ936_12665 [Proteobacteria bacterium]|nr:hypothetical protein [Pseudomonadota bacterium]